MSNEANSSPAAPSQTDVPPAADSEPLPPFQVCLSFGILIGAVVGAIGALVLAWIEFLAGGMPVLMIPVLAIGGLIGGVIAGGVAGAIVGAVVHPIVMAGRSKSSAIKPAKAPDGMA